MLLCLLTLTPVSSGSLEYCVWLEEHSEPTKWFCEIGQVSTGHGKGNTHMLLFLVGTFLCFLREGLHQSFFGWWVLILTWRSIPSCHVDVLVAVQIPKHQTMYCPWVVWSIKRVASHSASGAKPRGDARPEELFVREAISKDKPQTFSMHYKTHPGFSSEF